MDHTQSVHLTAVLYAAGPAEERLLVTQRKGMGDTSTEACKGRTKGSASTKVTVPARLGKEFKKVTTTSSTARGTESGSTKRRKREGG